MRQSRVHTLAEFVYRTFGKECADLLMAGYNERQSRKIKKFHVTEESAGTAVEWVVEVDGHYSPGGQEPLVLAALLKLLLQRPIRTSRLEFEMDELVEELGWGDSQDTHKKIDRAIAGYASLFFYKEPRKKRGGKRIGVQWGQYSLVTAYIRGSITESEVPKRIYSRVEFDRRFVEGLKGGQVYLADIYFGPLHVEKMNIDSVEARQSLSGQSDK